MTVSPIEKCSRCGRAYNYHIEHWGKGWGACSAPLEWHPFNASDKRWGYYLERVRQLMVAQEYAYRRCHSCFAYEMVKRGERWFDCSRCGATTCVNKASEVQP